VELRDGNIGYLDLRFFTGQPEAYETIVAAMNFLANANAVIIDLRNNGGGNPYTIQIISSYFLEEYTHLNSFERRGEDTFQQFWTLRGVPGKKMYDTDLFILTSRRTFSAAEEFTYNLKNLKRATIVGETTGGGAHPGGFRIITDNFLVWVPNGRAVNPITKTNWEGTGIEPHVKVERDKALDKAHALALEKLLEKTEDESKKFSLQWGLDGLKARLDPAVVDLDILKKYVGSYTRGSITLEKDTLYLEAGTMTFKMIPVSESYFVLEGDTRVRLRFEQEPSGKYFDATAIFSDGNTEKIMRVVKKDRQD
jgi:C-terminal processing protease CtpA/Prc